MATNPFDEIPGDDVATTAVANPFDEIPAGAKPVNPFDEIPGDDAVPIDLLEPTAARKVPDLLSTVQGGPKISLPPGGSRAVINEVAEGVGQTLSHHGIFSTPGHEVPMLTEKLPQATTPLGKAGRGAARGVEELARGIADFFTSGSGLAQLGLAASPVAPAIYAKWSYDMAKAAYETGKQSIEDFEKEDWENLAKNLTVSIGSAVGAKGALGHGKKILTNRALEMAPMGIGEPARATKGAPVVLPDDQFKKSHKGAEPPVPVETVALDPATGNPIPSSAQSTLNKAAQRMADIEAQKVAPKAEPAAPAPVEPVAPAAAKPISHQDIIAKERGETTIEDIEALSNEETRKLFAAKKPDGERQYQPQYDSVFAGMKLGPEALPKLKALLDKFGAAAKKAIEDKEFDVYTEMSGKNQWVAGAIEGAKAAGGDLSGGNFQTAIKFATKRNELPKFAKDILDRNAAPTVESLAADLGLEQPKVLSFAKTPRWSFHDPVTKGNLTVEAGATKEVIQKALDDLRKSFSPENQGAGKPPVEANIPPVVGAPPEVPGGFPKQGPKLTKADLKPGENLFRKVVEQATEWKNRVGEWLKSKPENKAIVWDVGNGNIRALTRNIGNKPWRVTSYTPHKGGLMPTGHREYSTRLEAMAEEGRDAGQFHEKIPGRVLTEQEIYGYKLMKDIPDKSVLTWYKTNPKYAHSLFSRLRTTTLADTFVKDSLTPDGRVAFTEALSPKDANNLRLKAEKLADPAAEMERVFQQAKSTPDEFSGVDATHLGKAERRALSARGMSFSENREGRIIGTYTAKARAEDLRRKVEAEAKAARGPQQHPIKAKAESRPADVIDLIIDNFGAIRLKSTIEGGGGDNYGAGYKLAARNNPKSSTGTKRLFSKFGSTPDVLVTDMIREGLRPEGYTVDSLWKEIDAAHEARAAWNRGERPEQQMQKFHAALGRQEKRTRSTEPVSSSDLQIGTKFKIEGETFEVTFLDPDTGEVTVKDGRKFGQQDIPDSAIIRADKGSIVNPEAPVEFVPEMEAEAPVEPVKPVEPPKLTAPPEPVSPVEPPKPVDMTGKDLVDATGKDDLSLVAEKGVDVEKAQAEAAQKAKDKAEAESRQQGFEGMGAAVPKEFEGGSGDYVSNMFAAIDRDRAAMGKPPMEKGDPLTWDESNQRALAKMNRDPGWIPNLLEDFRSGRRTGALEPHENAALVWHRAKLKAEFNNALARINRAFEDGNAEGKLEARLDANRFEAELRTLDQVVGRGGTGTAAGRALQAQKMAAGDDFTLIEMRLERSALENDGAPLSPKQEAEVQALYDKIKETRDEFEKYKAEVEAKESARVAKEALEEIERQKKAPKASSYVIQVAEKWVKEWDKSAEAAKERLRKKGVNVQMSLTIIDPTMLADYVIIGRAAIGRVGLDIAKFGEEMVSTFGESIKPHIQQLFDASKKLVDKQSMPPEVKKKILTPKVKDMTPEQRTERLVTKLKDKLAEGAKKEDVRSIIQQLAREGVESGVRGWEALLDYVHEVVRGIDPEFTRRDTMDAISGYGKYKELPIDEVSVALREAKGEMQQVAKIEDITSGVPPKPTGIERRTPSEAERAKIKIVNELKKKHPELFEGSGLKSSLESRKTYYRNRMSDLRAEIAARELAIKDKTPPPTDAELNAIKAEYDAVKAEHDAMFKKGVTREQLIKLMQASLERQIGEYGRRISAKDFSKKKPSPVAKATELDALKAERDALREEFNALRDLDPQWQSEQAIKKLELDKATLERTIAEQERKLQARDFAPKKKPLSRPAHKELEPLRQRLDELNRQLKEARKPKRSQAEIWLQQYKSRRARQIADWTRRMAEQDFSKRKPKEFALDPQAMELLGQAEKAKNEYLKKRWEWHQSQRTTGRKIWDGIQKSRGAFVNIASSFDFSAPRQALLAILSNTTRLVTSPRTGAKLLAQPMKDMFRAWASDRAARGIEQRQRNRPNALSGADKAAKVEYSELDSNKFTKYEENAHSVLDEWAELPLRTGNTGKTVVTALPKLAARGVRMSNRAFITFLNQTRAALLDELLRVNFKDRPPTTAELELIGNMVNIATGRGKMNAKTAQVASEVLWAPKLLASRVQFLTGQPLWTGKWAESARGRKIVAKEYARIIMGGFLLATVARMFSDKKEDDPTSSDFGKIVRGKTRIDPWGGLQQVTTLGARTITASTKTLKGDVRSIGADKKYGQKQPWYVWADFIRSKLRPDVATAVDIGNRTLFGGEKTTAKSVATNLLVPLPMREITTIMKENGFTEGMIIEALGQFGAGVSVYEDKESQR